MSADVQEYFREGVTGDNDTTLVVRGQVLWVSEHRSARGPYIRLHVTDAEPEESFEELLSVRSLMDMRCQLLE